MAASVSQNAVVVSPVRQHLREALQAVQGLRHLPVHQGTGRSGTEQTGVIHVQLVLTTMERRYFV